MYLKRLRLQTHAPRPIGSPMLLAEREFTLARTPGIKYKRGRKPGPRDKLMAKVVLPFEQYKVTVPLPPLCIRCGAPATRTIKMMFFGKAVKFLGMTFITGGEEEYMIADTPLCDRHRFMGMAKPIIAIWFLILLVLCGLGAVLKPWMHHYLVAFPIIAIVLVGLAFILYVSITSIGGQGYTKKGVTVTGVSRVFIDALEEREWTEEAFAAGIRKNRKARKRPHPPFWISPWFFTPVGIGLAFLIFTPVGWLVARSLPDGPWPAGRRADPVAAPVVAPSTVPPPQPVKLQPEPLVPQSLPGLLAYWPLDDNQGPIAIEKSGNGFAHLRGGQWIDGVKGSALRLDGKKDYVDLGQDGRLNFAAGAEFTVAAWVATDSEQGVICSFRRRTAAFPVIDLLVKAGQLHGWVRDDASGFGGARVTGGAVKDGKWHHVALLRHADGTVELFLDAVSQARGKGEHSGGAITTDLRALGSERFMIQTKKAGPGYFAGIIDEFCVYGRALNADEIATLAGAKK